MSTPPTVILVHGACHGNPSYVKSLISWLTYLGIPTVGTKCPSDGCVPADKGMYDDAKYVRELIVREIETGKDVMLFMHSYGGVVGTEAAKGLSKQEREKEGKKGGVSHLYYLCAFMLQEGQSLISCLQENPDLVKPAATIHDDGRGTFENPKEVMYNDLIPSQQDYWSTQLHHYTLQDNLDVLTHSTWKDIPTTYVFCTNDQAISIAMQEIMVKKVQESGAKPTGGKELRTERWECGHSPYLKMPAVVAESVARACKV